MGNLDTWRFFSFSSRVCNTRHSSASNALRRDLLIACSKWIETVTIVTALWQKGNEKLCAYPRWQKAIAWILLSCVGPFSVWGWRGPPEWFTFPFIRGKGITRRLSLCLCYLITFITVNYYKWPDILANIIII